MMLQLIDEVGGPQLGVGLVRRGESIVQAIFVGLLDPLQG